MRSTLTLKEGHYYIDVPPYLLGKKNPEKRTYSIYENDILLLEVVCAFAEAEPERPIVVLTFHSEAIQEAAKLRAKPLISPWGVERKYRIPIAYGSLPTEEQQAELAQMGFELDTIQLVAPAVPAPVPIAPAPAPTAVATSAKPEFESQRCHNMIYANEMHRLLNKPLPLPYPEEGEFKEFIAKSPLSVAPIKAAIERQLIRRAIGRAVTSKPPPTPPKPKSLGDFFRVAPKKAPAHAVAAKDDEVEFVGEVRVVSADSDDEPHATSASARGLRVGKKRQQRPGEAREAEILEVVEDEEEGVAAAQPPSAKRRLN